LALEAEILQSLGLLQNDKAGVLFPERGQFAASDARRDRRLAVLFGGLVQLAAASRLRYGAGEPDALHTRRGSSVFLCEGT